MANNYFKVGTQLFFFNDLSEADTQRAFDAARTKSNDLSVFRVPRHPGAWDRVGIIGHRKRGEILADMGRTHSSESLFWLREELSALDRAYFDAGRDTVPTMGVAA